jgi:hypothetical protein
MMIIHTKTNPDAATWSAACRAMGEGLNRDPRVGTLVMTDGAGPSGAQREELALATQRKKYRVSVVSSAPAVRFIVSSIALFNPKIQTFLPADFRKGLQHLGVDIAELRTVERAIKEFAQRPNADRFAVLTSVATTIR